MARRPRAAHIENRTNRLKLEPRRKPYYVNVAPGIALGYRRNRGAGTWTVKASNGAGGNWIKAFAVADDHEDSNADTVLNFWEAQDRARSIARGNSAGGDRPITVSEAVDNYEVELKARGGDSRNASRVRHHLPASLGAKAVGLLTARELRHWRDGLLKQGLARASANRTGQMLKRALNLAANEDHRITNTAAWRSGLARPPDSVVARNTILPDDAVRALVAAAYDLDPTFGLWVELHAVTGARTSQLEHLEVCDLQDDGSAPRLQMPSSRKGNRRRIERRPVPIPAALARSLRSAAGDRAPHEPLLQAPASDWLRRNWIKRAVIAAGLDRKTTIYALRHSSVVRMLLGGTPVRVVAVHHDTSVTQIEAHYSRYISDHADTMVRRTLIDIAAPTRAKVIPLPVQGGGVIA